MTLTTQSVARYFAKNMKAKQNWTRAGASTKKLSSHLADGVDGGRGRGGLSESVKKRKYLMKTFFADNIE